MNTPASIALSKTVQTDRFIVWVIRPCGLQFTQTELRDSGKVVEFSSLKGAQDYIYARRNPPQYLIASKFVAP